MRVFHKNWLLPTLAVLLIAGSLTMNFSNNFRMLVLLGYACLFFELLILNLSISNLKYAKPIIKLLDFGFEIKSWKDSPPCVCAFFDVNNEPKNGSINDVNSSGVYPVIVWTDEHGEIFDKNTGRWFIPNED